MNENIYNAPESNTSKAEDFVKNDKPIFLDIFDKPMLFAAAIQIVLISLLSVASLFNNPNMGPETARRHQRATDKRPSCGAGKNDFAA